MYMQDSETIRAIIHIPAKASDDQVNKINN